MSDTLYRIGPWDWDYESPRRTVRSQEQLVQVEIDYEAAWSAYNRRLDLDGVPSDQDFETVTPNAVNELGIQEAVNAAFGIGGDDG
jgi:hypothetical protein